MLMKLKLVFFMPNEEIFKKDDLSRELALVNFGACCIYEDDKVARVVRHDVSILLIRRCIAVYVKFTPVMVSAAVAQVPNVAPILGELAFFIGVPQPATVRARPDGDVHLLVLSRDDSDDLLQNYPEQVVTI